MRKNIEKTGVQRLPVLGFAFHVFLLRAPFGQYGPVAALHWALVCVARHDSRPGLGGSRSAASCQRQARRPSAIRLHHSAGGFVFHGLDPQNGSVFSFFCAFWRNFLRCFPLAFCHRCCIPTCLLIETGAWLVLVAVSTIQRPCAGAVQGRPFFCSQAVGSCNLVLLVHQS